MKLTANFDFDEFLVSATRPDLVETPGSVAAHAIELLATRVLQPLRDTVGAPLTITSGYRSRELNRAIGGSPTSQHLRGEAADVTCFDPTWLMIALMADRGHVGQVILYPHRHFVHIALPSVRYPVPSFFVSPSKNTYHPVANLAQLRSRI